MRQSGPVSCGAVCLIWSKLTILDALTALVSVLYTFGPCPFLVSEAFDGQCPLVNGCADDQPRVCRLAAWAIPGGTCLSGAGTFFLLPRPLNDGCFSAWGNHSGISFGLWIPDEEDRVRLQDHNLETAECPERLKH